MRANRARPKRICSEKFQCKAMKHLPENIFGQSARAPLCPRPFSIVVTPLDIILQYYQQ